MNKDKFFDGVFGKDNDFWDRALTRCSAQAECTQCSTTAQYTGSATEVNAALREFKEIHKDCDSGEFSTVDSAKAKPVVKIHEVI
jgi:hypothetical protein